MQKPIPAALILVLAWTVWRLVFLLHTGIPVPEIHDEFSYLLGADTFAHGRLANPSPEFSKFFESPHILVRPTYASKYPPGQAIFLAAGKILFGSFFFGVILGNALMLFAICLMLFSWVRPRWAILISVLFALYLHPAMYWTDSYWGGSVAASGGALVLLSIGIARDKQTPLGGALFAIGALLLFWTRPYEGGVFTLSILILFARQIWRNRSMGAMLTAACLLFAGGIFTCCDNRAVTGHPLQLPYLLHDREYNTIPVFWFLPKRPDPTYTHPRLAAQHGKDGWEATQYRHSGSHWRPFVSDALATLKTFDGPLSLALLLTILLPAAWRDLRFQKIAIIVFIFLFALSLETFHFEHYAAPAWGAFALAIAVWAERVESLQSAFGLPINHQRIKLTLLLLALGVPALWQLAREAPNAWKNEIRQTPENDPTAEEDKWPRDRAALTEHLSSSGPQKLVIVRYPSPDWNVGQEWVYNSADIDHQRVVFAHDLGPEEDKILLRYDPYRTALLLTIDGNTGQENLQAYPSSTAPQ